MSNLAIEQNLVSPLELAGFIEEINTPHIKPSVLKFQRNKHPTGFGEQKLNAHYPSRKDCDRSINAGLARKLAQTSSIEEGLTEVVIGTILSKPAYADCAEDYKLSQEAYEYTKNWQQMDRYSLYLFNNGRISEDELECGHIPLEYFPEFEDALPTEWVNFLFKDEASMNSNFGLGQNEDSHWSDVLDSDEQAYGKGYNPEIEFGITNDTLSSYVAPQPMDRRVRTWYAGKGKAARLTQKQYTADCGSAVPENYDSYED